MAKNKFSELLEGRMELVEAVDGKPRSIRVNGAMTAEIVNGNRRIYPSAVLEAAVAELRNHLNESAGQGRAVQMLGEAEHPSDKGGRANLLETVVKWNEVNFDGTKVDIVGHVLPTSKGRDILTLLENGVMPGVSMRGYGEGKTEGKGADKIFRVNDLHMNGFDLVLEPSFQNQVNLIETKIDDAEASGENEMSDELLETVKKQEVEKAELQRQLNEAQKLIADGEKAKVELEEAKRKGAVEVAIEEACKDLPFGEQLNAMFVESIKEASLADVTAVKQFAESKRKEYGKLAASGALVGMGFKGGKITGVQSVLEAETGIPEIARASFELTESLRKREMRAPSDLRKREDRAAVLTMQLLERFDKLYQKQLISESQMFNEAELTTDLNLPYSVSRAIIAEAYPSLVSANVFDIGLMNNTPERIYYEAFAGETGYSVAITDEVETAGAEGSWYDLANKNLVPGTVTVTSNPAGTTYVEGTDFVIDYEYGKILALVPGSIGANDLLVTYTYHATRKGENAEIERGKVTLSYQTIEASAVRLADYISDEAIKFSRTQLGWDAVSRTMFNLIRQIRLDTDKALIEKAMASALGVASNSGGTWDISDALYADLVAKLGVASALVANRYYQPTSILCSVTNAERLSNWTGFQRDGFPNALVGAAGFANMIVKGLPVFASTQMRDNWFLVMNREIVMHRVYSPMTVKGPYPIYSNGKLVAGEQYYAEEYNASLAPIGGKAAYVATQA